MDGNCARFYQGHVSSQQWEPMGPPPLLLYQPFPMRTQQQQQLSMPLGAPPLQIPLHGCYNGIVQGNQDALYQGRNDISRPVARYLQMHKQQHRAWTARPEVLDAVPQHTVSPTVKRGLPFVLSSVSDADQLTKFQVFLRLHIEAFAASPLDVAIQTRGRNKQVHLNQVGVRCHHCAHVAINNRVRGAVYFPSSTNGFYQAAQNMCSTHLQCGLCPEMPESIKTLFAQLLATKTTTSTSAGDRVYWAQCAQQKGLVDTENGVYAAAAVL
jgi:hypothetical protein